MSQRHEKEISALKRVIEGLTEKLALLSQRISTLEQEHRTLRDRLSKYEVLKNSRNSAMPPSSDGNRPVKTKSLRIKRGNKPGGQPGRKGNTLKMTTQPDQVIDHQPSYCTNCGQDMSTVPGIKVQTRQVIDLSPMVPQWVEHRVFQKRCNCGEIVQGGFPSHVTAPVSYGDHVATLIGYWHGRQYLPFARMKEIFHDIFNLSISEGGIHYLCKVLVYKGASSL